MKKLIYFILFVLSLIRIYGPVSGQNIFILEKSGIKNYKYYQDDAIKIELQGQKIAGNITFITDSSLFINGYGEVNIQQISKIYTQRWGYSLLQKVLLGIGIPYLLLNTLNGTISKEQEMPGSKTLAISGGLIIAGIALTPLTSRTHTIKKYGKWKVKILDLTSDPVILE